MVGIADCPNMRFYKNGKEKAKYNASPDPYDIVKWVQKKVSPRIGVVTTAE